MGIFLNVNNVTKRFENHVALSNVSLSVRKGRIFGLLGPKSAAGKTTLIRILNRITAPDNAGEVIFDGRPMEPDDVMRIGYLPEERGVCIAR